MFALDGIDPRGWTAADRAAVAYLLAKQNTTDKTALRELYELADDRKALAVLDRQIMGQPETVEVTDVRPRHG